MIDVLSVFPSLNSELISLLKNLNLTDWDKNTVCTQWTIKDIVAHLLDTNIRRLSVGRDGHSFLKNRQFATYEELITYLNHLNADWVLATKRMSTNILIELVDKYQEELMSYFKDLDPFDMALFPVAWAGKEHSENWFDIAREYTERWLHQQQIRFALNDQTLLQPKFYTPYLQTALSALPHTYARVKADLGSTLSVQIVGDAGGVWSIKKEKNFWSFLDETPSAPDALIYIDQQISWLLFSKGINPMDASQYYQLHGNKELASHTLKMLAVMA